jgi:nitrate reductase (NAD(P)H)
MTQYLAASQQISRTSSSSPDSETNSSPSAFSHVPTTPSTAFTSLSGSPGPYQNLQNDGLPIPFFPASLDGPERNGPQLPQCLPQLPNNDTPTEVAEQVALEIPAHNEKLTLVPTRISRHQITGSIV